jgi:cell division protein FtsX
VNFATHTMIDKVNARISLSISLKTSYNDTNSEVVELLSDLKSAYKSPDIRYVSSTEALEILKKRDPELVKVIENDTENPLPSSILIKNIALDQYEMLDSIIKKHKSIIVYDEQKSKKSIVDYRVQYEKIKSLTNVLDSIIYGIYTIIGFFIFTVFLVVYSIIGNFIFYYRDEIKITQLV